MHSIYTCSIIIFILGLGLGVGIGLEMGARGGDISLARGSLQEGLMGGTLIGVL